MQVFKNFVRRQWKNMLFFLILILLLAAVSGWIERIMRSDDAYVQERNKSIYRILGEKENNVDVLVLGDSLSFSSVSPMLWWKNYGITGYVCGQPDQRMQEAYYMLKTAYTTQSPKLVILETNAMFRSKSLIPEIGDCIEAYGSRYISIFRGHDVWKSVLYGKTYPDENYKGYAFRDQVVAYEGGEYMQKTDEKEAVSDVVIFYLNRIYAFCRKNGAELLLISAPSPENYNYARHNSIEAYAAQKGIPYLDLNLETDEIGIDWQTDSLDTGDHLNCSGADKVTRYLGRYLAENYNLPDHRSDIEYQDWNDELTRYEAEAEQELIKVRVNSNK